MPTYWTAGQTPADYTGQNTDTHCHCGAAYEGSDHCPECGCEQWESYCDHQHESAMYDHPDNAAPPCTNQYTAWARYPDEGEGYTTAWVVNVTGPEANRSMIWHRQNGAIAVGYSYGPMSA